MRHRRDADRDFFVYMIDKDDRKRRVAVGNFFGGSPAEAIMDAQKAYRALFTRMETRRWIVCADEIIGARRIVAEDR